MCTFPAPDAPHRATVSPGRMTRLYPWHTWTLGREGYAKSTSRNSMTPAGEIVFKELKVREKQQCWVL